MDINNFNNKQWTIINRLDKFNRFLYYIEKTRKYNKIQLKNYVEKNYKLKEIRNELLYDLKTIL